ncbi:mCG1028748, partial [Mus musculus]
GSLNVNTLRGDFGSAAFLPRWWASCQFAGPRKKPSCSQRTRTSILNPPPLIVSGLLGLQHFNRSGVGWGGVALQWLTGLLRDDLIFLSLGFSKWVSLK